MIPATGCGIDGTELIDGVMMLLLLRRKKLRVAKKGKKTFVNTKCSLVDENRVQVSTTGNKLNDPS